MDGEQNLGRVVLIGSFVTALLVAQVTASKLIAVPYAVGGVDIVVPGGVAAYAVTYLASDCYAELYGRSEARTLVNVAFGLNFLLLGLIYVAIAAPYGGGVDAGAFETVLLSSGNIVAGSLVAYLVSQNWDVSVFHYLKDRTDGRYLWLRNVVSTGTSQAIDTVLFILVAFWFAPVVVGVGTPLPTEVLVSLLVGQYLVKLLIAVLDTPLVYLAVELSARRSRSFAVES